MNVKLEVQSNCQTNHRMYQQGFVARIKSLPKHYQHCVTI